MKLSDFGGCFLGTKQGLPHQSLQGMKGMAPYDDTIIHAKMDERKTEL